MDASRFTLHVSLAASTSLLRWHPKCDQRVLPAACDLRTQIPFAQELALRIIDRVERNGIEGRGTAHKTSVSTVDRGSLSSDDLHRNATMTTEEIIKQFCQQCSWLCQVFDEYSVLYQHSELRRSLLHAVAQQFFRDLNHILVEYILLNMCKLTDPPSSCGNDNLTFKQSMEVVGPDVSKQLGLDESSEKIHQIRPHVTPARNKIIAHADRNTLLSGETLGAFPKDVGDAFWEGLERFVDAVHRHYFHEPFCLRPVKQHGARQLISHLKASVHYWDYFRDRKPELMEEYAKMRYRDA